MDPNLIYWTAALLDLFAVCGFALLGVRHVRRGELARHQQAMKIATFLVFSFLISYALKLVFLGREDRSVWSTLDIWVLGIHELFVLQMVLAGGLAWFHSRRLVGTRLLTHDPADPPADPDTVRRHRLVGRVAVVGAVLGCLMAVGVLAGMYVRAYSA